MHNNIKYDHCISVLLAVHVFGVGRSKASVVSQGHSETPNFGSSRTLH